MHQHQMLYHCPPQVAVIVLTVAQVDGYLAPQALFAHKIAHSKQAVRESLHICYLARGVDAPASELLSEQVCTGSLSPPEKGIYQALDSVDSLVALDNEHLALMLHAAHLVALGVQQLTLAPLKKLGDLPDVIGILAVGI